MATFPSKGCRKSPSTVVEVIGGDENLITEILLRLPAKSLMRFNSVSKNWSAIISNHRFSLLWQQQQGSNSDGVSLLCINPRGYEEFLESIPLHGGKSELVPCKGDGGTLFRHILMCCNGLVLGSSLCPSIKPSILFHVYNPATRRVATLPWLAHSTFIDDIILVFDPSKSPHYKVFTIRRLSFNSPLSYSVEIYGSETNSWRASRAWDFVYDKDFRGGVLWDGVIFWLCRSLKANSLCFDVDEDRLQEVPSPPSTDQTDLSYSYVGESGGHLHYVAFIKCSRVKFVVYEMKRDCSNWFLKFRLDLSLAPHFRFSVICLIRHEIEEKSCLVLSVPGQIICYNLKDKASTKLLDLEPRVLHLSKIAHQYTQTLFRV